MVKVGKIELSLVLPAYNEAPRLEKCVEAVKRFLKGKKYEIIIAEDGSTDGTDKIAEKIAKTNKNIYHIHNDKKLGRGLALKNAFSLCKGKILAYLDVDMATDINHLKELIKFAKENDVVTGSRYLPGSLTERPILREFFSKVYNFLIRKLLGCKIFDSQCGFKAFSRKFFEEEIKNIYEKTWAWDTIVMVEAVKKGYKVKEFPVKWVEKKEFKTNVKRLIKDFIIHGKVIFKLFLKWRVGLNVKL